MTCKKFAYFLLFSFVFYDEAYATALKELIYDDDGSIVNNHSAYHQANHVFLTTQDSDLRLQAVDQIITLAKGHENKFRCFEWLQPLFDSDVNEIRMRAASVLKEYMKTTDDYWENYVVFLQQPPGMILYDKNGPVNKLTQYLEIIEHLAADEQLPTKPKEHLILSLDGVVYFYGDEHYFKLCTEYLEDIPYKRLARKQLQEAIQKAREIRQKIVI